MANSDQGTTQFVNGHFLVSPMRLEPSDRSHIFGLVVYNPPNKVYKDPSELNTQPGERIA